MEQWKRMKAAIGVCTETATRDGTSQTLHRCHLAHFTRGPQSSFVYATFAVREDLLDERDMLSRQRDPWAGRVEVGGIAPAGG